MIKRFFAALTLAILLASCAKEAPSLITDDMYDEFFNSWVKKNAPKATKLDNGVYMEYIHKANSADTTTIRAGVSWIYFSYTISTLDGTIFATRDSSLIRRLGTWSNNTHFIDDYQLLGTPNSYTNFCVGAQYAMLKMKTGDHARFYIPAKLAYYTNTLNINPGYQGEEVEYMGSPVIFEARIDKIVNNPVKFERDSVERWAEKNWNIRIKDTIFDGVYLRKTKVVPNGEKIERDQPVTVDITEFFTDYFIINTNVDSIAKRYHIYDDTNTSQYSPSKFNAGIYTEDVDEVITKAVLKMNRGERAEILCLSKWTLDGNEGAALNIPQIESYQPRIFRIRIYTQEEETEQKNK